MKHCFYLKYRDSGIEWLGKIPEHWKVKRLKYCAKVNMGQSPSSDDCNINGIGLPFLQGNGEFGNISPTPKQYCEKARKMAHVGDLLISVRAPVGELNIADQDYGIGRGLCSITPTNSTLKPPYCWYLLHHVREELSLYATGSTYEAVSTDDVGNISLLLPSKDEQDAVALFLDLEATRVDDLITKKKRLIELLQEKRAAIISYAVTKGLDPSVPMKDSGVEWLGNIPLDWELKKLKFITPSLTVGIVITPSKYYVEEGVPCPRSLNILEGQISDSNLVFISPESNELHAKSKLSKGDLVAVRTGQPGTTAVVDDRFDGANCIDLIIIRKSSRFDSKFMCYVLNSDFAKTQYLSGSSGAIQAHFNIETASNMIVPVPPVEEQVIIRKELNRVTERILSIIQQVEASIQLLNEHRRSLIYSAVTGKIDVRQEVA